ncbi:cyclin A [Salpingoeca rosetta]|uniref:Cyclin A n=1 Tax=Salpingoeca rosetta (strain ATCC 50818 / BSB-021) TaxID=946362 RepID=F2TWD5_SALR5|nr:cyclin A [Salpingoeca rosetta]EGD72381.1 cyclin A [Salpingoeca rosetta]|eukprot:XP_004998950.1 cyclin A [Salpingoeca rosetta]
MNPHQPADLATSEPAPTRQPGGSKRLHDERADGQKLKRSALQDMTNSTTSGQTASRMAGATFTRRTHIQPDTTGLPELAARREREERQQSRPATTAATAMPDLRVQQDDQTLPPRQPTQHMTRHPVAFARQDVRPTPALTHFHPPSQTTTTTTTALPAATRLSRGSSAAFTQARQHQQQQPLPQGPAYDRAYSHPSVATASTCAPATTAVVPPVSMPVPVSRTTSSSSTSSSSSSTTLASTSASLSAAPSTTAVMPNHQHHTSTSVASVVPQQQGLTPLPALLGSADFVDIDRPYAHDEGRVTEYVEKVMTYLRHLEKKFRPHAGYMGRQRDINHNMRSILVDWLVEVTEEYRLQLQTLYIAVGYIDRFLSNMAVQRSKLQLVGVTCMLLAAKYEEIYPPSVNEFVYITDNTYRREQVLKMEHVVLKVLRFDMGACTALTFLVRFIHAASATPPSHCLALYLAELSLLLGNKFIQYLPSVKAAAAICLSQHTFARPVWTPTFERYCRLSPEEVQPCLNDMFEAMTSAPHLEYQAIREKYMERRFHSVAGIAAPTSCPRLVDLRGGSQV